jgi:tetratricopeptide (TPR) repeat protein
MSRPNPLAQAPAGLQQAMTELEAGNLAAASAGATRLLDSHPRDFQVLLFAASVALTENRFRDSEQLFNRALEAAPDAQSRGMCWSGIGQIGKSIHNYDAAEESFRRAMLSDAGTVEHALEFADVLALRGKTEPALDVLRTTLMRHPRDPRPCVSSGNILVRSGRQRDALVFYDMALQRDLNHAPAHFNACVALTMLGNVEGALTACETALKLDPTLEGYYQLAALGGLKQDDPRLGWLEGRLADVRTQASTRIDAGFALSRVYDEAGDADRAFPPLLEANALKRGTISYDESIEIARIRSLTTVFTPDFMQRFAGASDSKLTPVFILGMPRSGTTLVEQMLAAHPRVKAGGELPFMPENALRLGELWGSRGNRAPGSDAEVRADLHETAEKYARQTAQLRGTHGHFTDKLPGNFLFIGLIHLMFPEARIIHCRRDPVDVCLSCFQRLFSSDVPYSYDLAELGRYHRLYQDLMRHWHETLPPGRILDVDYEELVADPEQGVRRMLEFCGLEYDPACLDFQNVKRAVSTASAVQVRKPLYSTSVHRWERYRKHLGPLLTALGMPPES